MQKINKRYLVTIIIISLLLSAAAAALYGSWQLPYNSSSSGTIILTPTGEKEAASQGSALGISKLAINGEPLDLANLPLTSGWSLENYFELHKELDVDVTRIFAGTSDLLYCPGSGAALTIACGEPVYSLEITCIQESDYGIVRIANQDVGTKEVSLYGSARFIDNISICYWRQLDWLLITLQLFVWVFILLLSLAYIINLLRQASCGQRKIPASLGMLNLTMGVAIILVIMLHRSWFFFDTAGDFLVPLLALPVYALLSFGLMQMFFISSGYNFRSMPVKKFLTAQCRLLGRPYLLFCAITIPLGSISRIWQGASPGIILNEAASFLFSPAGVEFYPAFKFLGIETYNPGPTWFIFALFIAGFLLNLICKLKNEYLRLALAAAAVAAGYVLGLLIKTAIPFALTQGLIGVGYLYLGLLLKKHKLLLLIHPLKYISILLAVVTVTVGAYWGGNFLEAHTWRYGLWSIFLTFLAGYALTCLGVMANRFENRFLNLLRSIGRYSLWIYLIHSVEYEIVPWQLIASSFGDYRVLGYICVLLLSLAINAAGLLLLKKISSYWAGKKFGEGITT